MLFYDLDLNAWIRTPGSVSPPSMSPVLTIGGVYELPVQFVRGTDVQELGESSAFAGIKVAGDFAGDYIASDNAPTEDGEGNLVFSMDLTTTDAKAYFVTNPTTETVRSMLQVSWVADTKRLRTVPLAVTIQNDYLTDQVTTPP